MAALACAVVAAAAYAGLPFLTTVLLALQVVLALALFAALDAPGSFGGLIVATGASAAADALLATRQGSGVGPLAGVMALAVIATLAHQLLRRRRRRIADSAAASLAVVMLDLAIATLLGLRGSGGGTPALVGSLVGIGGSLLLAGAGDLLLPRPPVFAGSSRGWPGLVVGLVGGCACAIAYATGGALSVPNGGKLGATAAGLALAADLVVGLGRLALAESGSERQRAALTPLAAVLPLAIAGPVVYVAARVIFG
ncbi:MAG: hypothetical protein ACYCO3_00090 [Mycobacteriales bacterium]